MGEMPAKWPPEFAKRATENLDLVLNSGTNDVTQTLLTLYALVVVPDEKDVFTTVDDMDRAQLEADGWPLNGWVWAYVNQRKNAVCLDPHQMKALLRMLRNALAHGHLEFESANGKIEAIRFKHKRRANHIEGRWTAAEAVVACRKILTLIGNTTVGGQSTP